MGRGSESHRLSFDERENKEKVIQPVIKQNAESDFSARISVLEEETRELRTLIEKEAHFFTNITKEDGLGRIRTDDLRRVKARNSMNSLEPRGISSQSLCFKSCMNDYELHNLPQGGLGELQLLFAKDELLSYIKARTLDLSDKTIYRVERAGATFWNITNGTISKERMDTLRQSILKKYNSEDSKGKMLAFAKSFLKYLTKTRLDTSYYAFEVFLDRPKVLKERKNVTSRIITKDDIKTILTFIKKSEYNGRLSHDRALQYIAFVVFGAYTGQRSLATISKLTVGQLRDALESEKPALHVKSSQDKIKMEHYIPMHPQVIDAVQPLLDGRRDSELMFSYNSFNQWIKRQKIPLTRISGHFVLGDLRKFAEQYGDIIQWEQSNRAYILTHGVSGVEWAHYKHPLPEFVYDVYMKYWNDVCFFQWSCSTVRSN